MSVLPYLVLAAVGGWLADRVLPERPPYGAAAGALAGVIAAVLVALPLGDLGPHLLEVAILPAAAGALVGALALRLVLARLVARSQ